MARVQRILVGDLLDNFDAAACFDVDSRDHHLQRGEVGRSAVPGCDFEAVAAVSFALIQAENIRPVFIHAHVDTQETGFDACAIAPVIIAGGGFAHAQTPRQCRTADLAGAAASRAAKRHDRQRERLNPARLREKWGHRHRGCRTSA